METGRRQVVIAALFALLLFASVTHAAVDVVSFEATWEGDNVRLNWQTGNESDHSSFRLWRSYENVQISNGQVSNADALSEVNTSPINSLNPCSISGQSYTALDRGVAEDADTVYYYLESFDGCNSTNIDYIGDGSGGWRVDRPEPIPLPTQTYTPSPLPSPTPTLTPLPSATATTRPAATATRTPLPTASNPAAATATTQPSNTPAPTNTLAPGVTPSPATATPQPSATQRGVAPATATLAVARTATPALARTATPALASSATRPASAPISSPTLNTPPPGSTPAPILATMTVPATLTPSLNPDLGTVPTPITVIEEPGLFPTATLDPALLSALPSPPAAATLPSILFQPPVTQAAPTPVPTPSTYDSFIRGLIGLILLAAVAVGGYVGWLYMRHPHP